MRSMSLRVSPMGFLAVLTLLSWTSFALVAATLGEVHIMSLLAAVVCTAMLVAWPFLTGARASHGSMVHPVYCKDCGRSVLPAEVFGFCFRCGSVKFAKPQAIGA